MSYTSLKQRQSYNGPYEPYGDANLQELTDEELQLKAAITKTWLNGFRWGFIFAAMLMIVAIFFYLMGAGKI